MALRIDSLVLGPHSRLTVYGGTGQQAPKVAEFTHSMTNAPVVYVPSARYEFCIMYTIWFQYMLHRMLYNLFGVGTRHGTINFSSSVNCKQQKLGHAGCQMLIFGVIVTLSNVNFSVVSQQYLDVNCQRSIFSVVIMH